MMRNPFLLVLTLSIVLLSCSTPPLVEVTAMTFNIRFDNPNDGPSAWPYRADWVASVIERESPDVLGLQEALRHQIDTLSAMLPGYTWLGKGRDDGFDGGEFSPLFIRTDRFDIEAWDVIWLSDTPDSVGSVGWDAALPRVATWARLRDRVSGRPLLAVNTHFDHRGETARTRSAELLARRFLSGDRATLLTGDFNLAPVAEGYAVLTGAGQDAFNADTRSGPEGTWTGFLTDGEDGDRIDYIFFDGPLRAKTYRAINESNDGRYVSDHRPVVATFAWTD